MNAVNVVAIIHVRTGEIVALVERPSSMSVAGVALAWAKSNGYDKLPSGVRTSHCPLIPYSSVQRALTPYTEQTQ